MQKLIFLFCSIFLVGFGTLKAQDTEAAWERQLEAYFQRFHTPYLTKLRFFTYFYVIQNLSLHCPQSVQDLIAAKLIAHFFPDCRSDLCDISDSSTKQTAEDLLCPFLVRIGLEESSFQTFQASPCQKQITKINQVAKWIPWSSEIPSPPPPLPADDKKAWQDQLNQLKDIRSQLTREQKETMKNWAEHHGKNHEWRVMANTYMKKNGVSLEKIILVRAVLMKGLYDGQIAEQRAKYRYCIPRPYVIDSSLKPLIRPLQSPSYPSGHAICGAIFSGIMSAFFPEDLTLWKNLKEEGANTRLWAGVHYPNDIEAGNELGEKIADRTLIDNGFMENGEIPSLTLSLAPRCADALARE